MRVTTRALLSILFTAATAACRQAAPPAAAAPTPSPQSYGSLAEVMRSIPFPSSNIIFDTQTDDPGSRKTSDVPRKAGTSTTSTYSSVYGGWQGVEQSAVAIAETANLIMIPGRLCENGRPVPLDRADFKQFAQGLADAGKVAYKAAKTRNLDAMVEVSGTISDACAACHERYRDVPEGKERCL
ncbi:MAG: cytochrome c [Acidobacteriota bacterium]